MFEKFPQLKRLERLLTKTQAFSPRKPRLSASEGPSAAIFATRRATVLTVVWTQVVGFLALCPQDLLPLTQTQLKSLRLRQDDLGEPCALGLAFVKPSTTLMRRVLALRNTRQQLPRVSTIQMTCLNSKIQKMGRIGRRRRKAR